MIKSIYFRSIIIFLCLIGIMIIFPFFMFLFLLILLYFIIYFLIINYENSKKYNDYLPCYNPNYFKQELTKLKEKK
jgi:hypothetical protein